MRKPLDLNTGLSIIQETKEPIKKLAAENELAGFLYANAFNIVLNANDTFGYACADAVDIAIEDLPKLLEVHKLYGSDGVTAFMSLVEDCDVIPPLQTDKYKEAKQFLSDYRPCSWVH